MRTGHMANSVASDVGPYMLCSEQESLSSPHNNPESWWLAISLSLIKENRVWDPPPPVPSIIHELPFSLSLLNSPFPVPGLDWLWHACRRSCIPAHHSRDVKWSMRGTIWLAGETHKCTCDTSFLGFSFFVICQSPICLLVSGHRAPNNQSEQMDGWGNQLGRREWRRKSVKLSVLTHMGSELSEPCSQNTVKTYSICVLWILVCYLNRCCVNSHVTVNMCSQICNKPDIYPNSGTLLVLKISTCWVLQANVSMFRLYICSTGQTLRQDSSNF